MEAWLIVLITVGSGIALFITIFILKTKKEQKRNERIAQQQATMANAIAQQAALPQNSQFNNYQPNTMLPQQPPPYNNIYQPGTVQPQQVVYINPNIPSTANQGIINTNVNPLSLTNDQLYTRRTYVNAFSTLP